MAPKTRINITVDEDTIRLADRLARGNKTSRSAVLREGVRVLAENYLQKGEGASLRERRRKAIEGIRRIAHLMGDWPAERIVHEWRYRLNKKGK
jgi:hypothetical protein